MGGGHVRVRQAEGMITSECAENRQCCRSGEGWDAGTRRKKQWERNSEIEVTMATLSFYRTEGAAAAQARQQTTLWK
jgi:hypothetical protein